MRGEQLHQCLLKEACTVLNYIWELFRIKNNATVLSDKLFILLGNSKQGLSDYRIRWQFITLIIKNALDKGAWGCLLRVSS